jgi:TPR repeat protein
MRIKNVGSLWMSIVLLGLGLSSPVAFATPEEDFASAEKSFNREDVKEATRFLRLSADQNYFPAQIRIGELMNGAEDHEEAFGWFLTAAFQGDAAGQYNVGQMYGLGTGVQRSPEKAFYWTKKSAEQDYLVAVQLLATAYSAITDDKGGTVKNMLGLAPNKEQADFWGAKLPKLQEAQAKAERKAAMLAKKRAEELKKAKEEKEKLSCGLKC